MRSSIFSSDIYTRSRAIPAGAWQRPLAVSVVLLIAGILMLESALAGRGFRPNVVDSSQRWAQERKRASELGHRALVLVGASRALLDLDLTALGEDSGRVPVQLGIDGNSYLPVLADIAADDSVTGAVIVEYQDSALGDTAFDAQAQDFVREARRERNLTVKFNFLAIEATLASFRQRFMRSYADGAGPFVALTTRAFSPRATPQYLVTLPSRERSADYSLVSMPYTYYDRAARNAGFDDVALRGAPRDVESALSLRIRGLASANFPDFKDNAARIATMVRRIEARGGEVVFVVFPRSGLVWEADAKRYPRADFWDRFRMETGAKGVHYLDVPALTTFQCPDGSHLDKRDKVRFTHALTRAISDDGWLRRSS